MASRSMDPMSRNFIHSPMGAEMLDIDIGEHSSRERSYAGPGRQYQGYNSRYGPLPRYPQRDWRSQYSSEGELSLPEKPLANANTNQMPSTFGNSFRPSQLGANQVASGLASSFMSSQSAQNTNQLGPGFDELLRSQQSVAGSGQFPPLFGDLFKLQQPFRSMFTKTVVPGYGDVFGPQQSVPGTATNPATPNLSDFLGPQQSAPGTATNPATPSLRDFLGPQPSAPGTATNPAMPNLSYFFGPQQSFPGKSTNSGTPSLTDRFRSRPLTPSTLKAAPTLNNTLRSLLASPNSNINKMLALFSPKLVMPPLTTKTQDYGQKANYVNSPQAVPRPLPFGGFPRPSFLGRVMTLGALDLIDMP